MFETIELGSELEYKSTSESVTPAKKISFETNLLKFKPSQKKIDELDLGESEDLTCFFIRSFKSKTQVSSPTFANFIRKQGPKYINEEDFDKLLKLNKSNVGPKDVKHKKISEKMRNGTEPEKLHGKFLSKNKEKGKKIMGLLDGLKGDYEDLKEIFNGLTDFKRILQDSLTVAVKQLSENRQDYGRNNSSIGSDSDIKVFSLKNENFKSQVFKKFEEIQEAFIRKMKNGALAFNQTIAELTQKIHQKDEKIQRVLKECSEQRKKNQKLEENLSELGCQLDSQMKENSELMQKYLRTFKELSNIKRNKTGIVAKEIIEPETEKLMNENKELKRNVNELENLIKGLTKNTGISQIKQENEKLIDQVKDLNVRLSREMLKSEKLEGVVKELEKNLRILNEKENFEVRRFDDSKNFYYDLASYYPKLNSMLNLNMSEESFESFLPKIQKFENFLESILNFRLNRDKKFTFPDEIIDYKQVPTKFIEKILSYLKFLLNISTCLLRKSLNFNASDKFIKELEYLIYSINEKHFEDTKKLRKDFKVQEDLFHNEILYLQKEVLIYKNKANSIDENCKTPIKKFISESNIVNERKSDRFVVESCDTRFFTPSKNRVQTELEAKVEELSESVKKYREKNELLKSNNVELMNELRDIQFSKKIS